MAAKLLNKLLRKKVRDMDMSLVLWIWSTHTRTRTQTKVLVLTHFFSTRTHTRTHAKQSTRTRTRDLCTRPKPDVASRGLRNYLYNDFQWNGQELHLQSRFFKGLDQKLTRYVDGTSTSEVTPVTIRHIRPPHHGHTSQYHGHEWMTQILFVPCQSAIPFLR